MKILVVGAGAVGSVYAYHLQRGGAEVWLYVRPRYKAACERGITLYQLNHGRRRRRLVPTGCLTSAAEVAAGSWDQVWLCVSTTALLKPWFAEIAGGIGTATVVGLQPGPEARAVLLAQVLERQLVSGVITMVSYQAPLPGEKVRDPGIAYWLPPGSPNGFKGPARRTGLVVKALRAGGCPAAVHPALEKLSGFGSGLLMPLIASLELAGWSFSEFKRGSRLHRALEAAREACAAVSAELGEPPPFWLRMLVPGLARLLLSAAPHVVPLDLETYFRYHFTKVGDQTRALLGQYIDLASRHALPAVHLQQLRTRLG